MNRPTDCVCNFTGHCYACLAAGRRCALPGCRCTCADGRTCSSRRAPAMPLPQDEHGVLDESVPPDPAKPRVCTTSDGLVEALRASLMPTPAWASKPAAVHAMARDLNVDALDAHERARARRMSR